MNIIEPILFQCKLNPLTTAIFVPGSTIESVSYGLLEKFIHNAARSALKAGLAPGRLVAILVADTVLHCALTFGLMRAGIPTLSLRGHQIPKEIVPSAVLTDRPHKFAGQPSNAISVDHSWLEGDGSPPDYETICPTNDDALCRINLTTGSTGWPKGVALSFGDIAESISHQLFLKGPRFANCLRMLCDLGIATTPGLRYALSQLVRGGTIYFLGKEPADILQIFDLHKIEGMVTSPYGLGEFMKFLEADPAFDISLDHIVCQGALLSAELSRRARARLCPNIYIGYGSTETAPVAFGHASMAELIPGAVGYVLPAVRVEIVDKDGVVLPPNCDGSVRIRTRPMAKGYVGDTEATQQYFRHGYFYSGDIGRLRDDGILVITGRDKAALNIGGDIISPEIVEGILTSYPGVEDAAVLAVPNELGINEFQALVVARPAVTMPALRDHCASRLPPSCVPVRFVAVPKIPRGTQGKIERHRLEDFTKSALAQEKRELE